MAKNRIDEVVMKMFLPSASSRRALMATLLGVLGVSVLPAAASAQYFGRNKVQFDDFDFKVLSTEHFDWHFYPEEEVAVPGAAALLDGGADPAIAHRRRRSLRADLQPGTEGGARGFQCRTPRLLPCP